jgi:hypothetical protein
MKDWRGSLVAVHQEGGIVFDYDASTFALGGSAPAAAPRPAAKPDALATPAPRATAPPEGRAEAPGERPDSDATPDFLGFAVRLGSSSSAPTWSHRAAFARP